MVKSSIKQNWNQQVLQSRGHLKSSLGRHRPAQTNLMLYFDSSDSTPHHISTQRKARLFTDSGEENAFPRIQENVFYMIESFKISVMLTGLQTYCPQAWEAARQKPRNERWRVLCLQWLCWAGWTEREAANVQARGQGTVCTVHLPSLAASHTLLHHPHAAAENAFFPLPLLRFYKSFYYFLPNGALHQFQVMVEGGERKHKTQRKPNNSQNFMSKRIKGTLQDNLFSLIRYVCF